MNYCIIKNHFLELLIVHIKTYNIERQCAVVNQSYQNRVRKSTSVLERCKQKLCIRLISISLNIYLKPILLYKMQNHYKYER